MSAYNANVTLVMKTGALNLTPMEKDFTTEVSQPRSAVASNFGTNEVHSGSRESRHPRFADRLSDLEESPRYVDALREPTHTPASDDGRKSAVPILCNDSSIGSSIGLRRRERVQAVLKDPAYIHAVADDHRKSFSSH